MESDSDVSKHPRYKWCFVPMCTSTTKSTPNKLFVIVPRNLKRRKVWMKAARRDFTLSLTSPLYCCEDHFNMDEDMDNFVRYKLMGGYLKSKQNAVPHLFDCQLKRHLASKRIAHREAAAKRNAMQLVSDAFATVIPLSASVENGKPTELREVEAEMCVAQGEEGTPESAVEPGTENPEPSRPTCDKVYQTRRTSYRSKSTSCPPSEFDILRFPKDERLIQKWKSATGRRENWNPTKRMLLCSDHITVDNVSINSDRRTLNRNACPTIFARKSSERMTFMGSSDKKTQLLQSVGGGEIKSSPRSLEATVHLSTDHSGFPLRNASLNKQQVTENALQRGELKPKKHKQLVHWEPIHQVFIKTQNIDDYATSCVSELNDPLAIQSEDQEHMQALPPIPVDQVRIKLENIDENIANPCIAEPICALTVLMEDDQHVQVKTRKLDGEAHIRTENIETSYVSKPTRTTRTLKAIKSDHNYIKWESNKSINNRKIRHLETMNLLLRKEIKASRCREQKQISKICQLQIIVKDLQLRMLMLEHIE